MVMGFGTSNLGRPTETTDGWGNTTVSPHAPSTQFVDNKGNKIPVQDQAVNSASNQSATTSTPSADFLGQEDVVQKMAGQFSGKSELMQLAEDAKQQAIASGMSLDAANDVRNQYLQQGYTQAQNTLSPYAAYGSALDSAYDMAMQGQTPEAMGQYTSMALSRPDYYGSEIDAAVAAQNPLSSFGNQLATQQGMDLTKNIYGEMGGDRYFSNLANNLSRNRQEFSDELADRASGMPQSQYFQQAADLMRPRPERLEDIEGYDLMKQARDEALAASGQRFAGGGKLFSGSRGVEAANIGGALAQDLISRDAAQRQQDISNLMGMGAQDVALQQQGLQNLMGFEQAQGQQAQQQLQNIMASRGMSEQERQQDISNLMGLQQLGEQMSQQDFANAMAARGMTNQEIQQNLSNLMALRGQQEQIEQQDITNFRNVAMDQNMLNRQQMQDLLTMGGIGYDAAGRQAGMQLGMGEMMGAGAYGTAQDKANLLAGGTAQAQNMAMQEQQMALQQQLARQQQQQSNQSGWLGLLGMLGGALICDERLKENIEFSHNKDGINIYKFNYLGDDTVREGPMAQELLETHPHAVFEMDGYLAVDMGAI